MRKVLTLCMVHEPNRILLGMKKRGFGEGRWNGFGGKVGVDESIEDAARREVLEEADLTVKRMHEAGVLDFTFEGGEDVLEVHIFDVDEFEGVPKESEEMRPQWFALDSIPYSDMWPDDQFWLPAMLNGKTFSGAFHFGRDGGVARNELVIHE